MEEMLLLEWLNKKFLILMILNGVNSFDIIGIQKKMMVREKLLLDKLIVDFYIVTNISEMDQG